MTTVIVDRRFRGPPNSANGGYVAGLLARAVGPSAEVTLRQPPPLDTPMQVVAVEGGAELRHGETLIATGRAVELDVGDVPAADFAAAEAAATRPIISPERHGLPMCFACGPDRAPGDGLRLLSGPLDPSLPLGTSACAVSWMPHESLTGEDGRVADVFVWSALDCPTGMALSLAQRTAPTGERVTTLLGRLALRLEGRPRIGERCVVVTWPTGEDGRKHFADGALLGESGDVLAVARATWIKVDRQTQLGAA